MSTILNAWHDHEIETMKKMWLAGNSATEIARALCGRSRNSVVSKVHRLGLTRERLQAKASPPSTSRAPAVKRNRHTGGIKIVKPAPASSFGRFAPSSPDEAARKREHFAKHGAGIIDGFTEAANDTSILLIERRRFQCSWPVGEVSGAGQMCCGQPVDPAATGATETYCPAHHRRAVSRVLAASKAFGFGERRPARRAESTPWDQGRAA